MLGVLLLFKMSRNLIEFRPFKTSCERIFFSIRIVFLKKCSNFSYRCLLGVVCKLKGGDRRVRIFSAHKNWWATPEVSSPLPYQRSAKVFLNLLRQGVKAMYHFKNVHSK